MQTTSARGYCARSWWIGAALAACCLAGCQLPNWARNGFKVGPQYEPPAALVAEDWIDSNDPRVLPQPPAFPDWWAVFNDPVIDELVQVAYQQNLTLREAGARILQARATRGIAVGNLLPQEQQAFGAYEHIQLSNKAALHLPLFFPRAFDNWTTGVRAAWELDVWGRFRRAVEAADANLDASVFEYDAILVSLIAEVAAAYVEIRTFEQRIAYARDNVEIQTRSLERARKRAKKNKLESTGVHLAKSNLDETLAILPVLETGKRQAQNRLCTLLGIPPTDLASCFLGKGDGIPRTPAALEVGIPADLLRRRPDVRAAERVVAERSALIGVATAELYPAIAVTGRIGVEARSLDRLFTPGSTAGLIAPSFTWNVLNYGRILNDVRLQDARLLEAIAGYQNLVLTANREVEDALIAFLNVQETVTKLQDAVRENRAALDELLDDYDKLGIPFAPIFLLQAVLRANQDRLAEAQGQQALTMIGVYRALGGGWQIRLPDHLSGQAEEAPPPQEAPPAP
ncbi:MAG: efflux transporter outer membrane subunit [Gemmataceae bacterium]